MPSWSIHNKWAEKIGISEKVSDFVNRLIDVPEECEEFTEDQRKIYRIEHDSGRKRKTVMYVQLNSLRKKGSEFIKAWFLHHALDYVAAAPILSIDEVMKRLEERTERRPELEAIKDFVRKNSEGILRDCR